MCGLRLRARIEAAEAIFRVVDPEKLLEIEYCQESFRNFVDRAWPVIEPGVKFIPGKAIDAICDHLQAITNGAIRKLAISVPPGMSKSTCVSVLWPAWEWTMFPHYKYISTSHSVTLSIRDNVKCRRLIMSDWYQSLWGNVVQLTGDQNEKVKFENTRSGFKQACAFESLTGSRGNRLLMDDVMSVSDAGSAKKRETIEEIFLTSAPSRVNDMEKDAFVVIQQRLNVRDVIGLTELKELGYEQLSLPMEFEADSRCKTSIGFCDWRKKDGELLFPERFSRAVVDDLKKTLGGWATASQLQQRPFDRDGGMFERNWFDVVAAAPEDITWVRGWDLAATERSRKNNPAYTAGVLIGLARDGSMYISNISRGQLSPKKVEHLIVNTASMDPPNCLISIPKDPGAAGVHVASYFSSALVGYNVRFSPETGSKEQRAEPFSAQCEAGNVHLLKGAWNEAFLDEVATFPHGSHLDQIDACSRAFSEIVKIKRTQNTNFSAPIIVGEDNV